MASIDVRANKDEKIDKVIFTEESHVEINYLIKEFSITDQESGEYFSVDYSEIDNLIKALIKAKELLDKEGKLEPPPRT